MRSGLTVLAMAALLVACADNDGSGSEDDDPREAAESHDDEGLGGMSSHIHGLGVHDGSLYVATHNGLFDVPPDGEPRQVSEDDHDFMGFTVVDDGTLLASGHPNSRDDLPANLGLLESTDDGATWTSLALMGEVDFHALDAKRDAVYGFNSVGGELMSSTNRKDWDQLGQVRIADVTMSPDDESTVVITTEDGPLVSSDSGQTFDGLDGAPLLVLVDWPRTDEFYGIGPAGDVHVSADGGGSWAEQGTIGAPPQAMTVGADGTVYAATEEAIVRSDDGGASFTVVVDLTP